MDSALKRKTCNSWKAYLRWHLVHANAPYLSSAFVNADFDFFGKTLSGAQELEPRWKRCVSYADNDLGEALGRPTCSAPFRPRPSSALRNGEANRRAMEQDIDGLPWMSPATKQQALEKLHTVANKIGYPDKWRDYSALTIARDDELGNVCAPAQFEFQPPDGKDWQAGGPR